MVTEQKKTREPANADGTYSQRLQNTWKHAPRVRKLASLMDGDA